MKKNICLFLMTFQYRAMMNNGAAMDENPVNVIQAFYENPVNVIQAFCHNMRERIPQINQTEQEQEKAYIDHRVLYEHSRRASMEELEEIEREHQATVAAFYDHNLEYLGQAYTRAILNPIQISLEYNQIRQNTMRNIREVCDDMERDLMEQERGRFPENSINNNIDGFMCFFHEMVVLTERLPIEEANEHVDTATDDAMDRTMLARQGQYFTNELALAMERTIEYRENVLRLLNAF